MKLRTLFFLGAAALSCLPPPVTTRQDLDNLTFSGSVFITDARIDTLRARLADRVEPNLTACRLVLEAADQGLSRAPRPPVRWHVPAFYRDKQGHQQAKNVLRDDANASYAMALAYRITDDERYAQGAMNIIHSWVTLLREMSRRDDSSLSFSYHFPPMVFAADLLRSTSVWDPNLDERFRTFLREKALPMSTMDRETNWGNWGLVLSMACAVYLEDRGLLQTCIDRWKYFIENQMDSRGHLVREVTRSDGEMGFWYSHFCLMPQTIATEIARVQEVDLYDYQPLPGRSLRNAFQRIAGWVEQPDTFPYWPDIPPGWDYISYFEILHNRWPSEQTARLLDRFRPLNAEHGAPFLTFTHGGIVEE
jgi:hypothetical protein